MTPGGKHVREMRRGSRMRTSAVVLGFLFVALLAGGLLNPAAVMGDEALHHPESTVISSTAQSVDPAADEAEAESDAESGSGSTDGDQASGLGAEADESPSETAPPDPSEQGESLGDEPTDSLDAGSPAPGATDKPSLLMGSLAVALCTATEATSPATGSPAAGFEIDGNFCLNDEANQDWSSVDGVTVSDGYGDSTWFTRGADETNWRWTLDQTTGNSSTSSNDIDSVHAWTQTSAADEVHAYFGFERATTNGTVAYYVELNALANDCTDCPIPNRSPGDIRLAIFQDGNQLISLARVDKWTGTAWQNLSTGDAGDFIGQANTGTVTNLAGNSLDAGRFAEVAVNLSTLFESSCTGNFGWVNIRSAASTSDSSSLKDWVAPIALNVPATCSSVMVTKKWEINGTDYADGDQPDGYSASPTLTPAPAGGSIEFGQEYDTTVDGGRYEKGATVTVGENTPVIPEGCSNVASGDSGEHVLTTGLNTFEIVNTVTCESHLSIEKQVNNRHGGTLVAADWDEFLFAKTDAAEAIPFANGQSKVVEPGTYTISETQQNGYELVSITCDGGTFNSENKTVEVAQGADVSCTITNQDQPGSVSWAKHDVGGNSLSGSIWTLAGPGNSSVDVEDCVEESTSDCIGADKNPAAGQFELKDLDWGDYTLTEKWAPAGYVLDTTEHDFTIGGDHLTQEFGPFINEQAPSVALPLTGGTGRDAFLIAGGVLLLAGACGGLHQMYRRRQATA